MDSTLPKYRHRSTLSDPCSVNIMSQYKHEVSSSIPTINTIFITIFQYLIHGKNVTLPAPRNTYVYIFPFLLFKCVLMVWPHLPNQKLQTVIKYVVMRGTLSVTVLAKSGG